MKFNDRLKTFRHERGLTQKQMAKELGIVLSTYSNYELGRREPNIQNLRGISHILEVPLDVLLETDFMPTAPRARQEYSDLDLQRCPWGDAAGVSQEMIDQVREYAKFIAEKK
ncbi:MAG: helix-turn-helix transcriptional regulator [Eubacterium sp.]|nr:helix-turn-helix transcriptional regulator [Eubacterium sp.]